MASELVLELTAKYINIFIYNINIFTKLFFFWLMYFQSYTRIGLKNVFYFLSIHFYLFSALSKKLKILLKNTAIKYKYNCLSFLLHIIFIFVKELNVIFEIFMRIIHIILCYKSYFLFILYMIFTFIYFMYPINLFKFQKLISKNFGIEVGFVVQK